MKGTNNQNLLYGHIIYECFPHFMKGTNNQNLLYGHIIYANREKKLSVPAETFLYKFSK